MGRIQSVELRLERWADWKAGRDRSGLGYARVKYGPPMPCSRDPYDKPPISDESKEAWGTDQAVQRLPSELRRTVDVYYNRAGGERDCLRILYCARATLYARIEAAHRLLSAAFAAEREGLRRISAQHEKAQDESRTARSFRE